MELPIGSALPLSPSSDLVERFNELQVHNHIGKKDFARICSELINLQLDNHVEEFWGQHFGAPTTQITLDQLLECSKPQQEVADASEQPEGNQWKERSQLLDTQLDNLKTRHQIAEQHWEKVCEEAEEKLANAERQVELLQEELDKRDATLTEQQRVMNLLVEEKKTAREKYSALLLEKEALEKKSLQLARVESEKRELEEKVSLMEVELAGLKKLVEEASTASAANGVAQDSPDAVATDGSPDAAATDGLRTGSVDTDLEDSAKPETSAPENEEEEQEQPKEPETKDEITQIPAVEDEKKDGLNTLGRYLDSRDVSDGKEQAHEPLKPSPAVPDDLAEQKVGEKLEEVLKEAENDADATEGKGLKSPGSTSSFLASRVGKSLSKSPKGSWVSSTLNPEVAEFQPLSLSNPMRSASWGQLAPAPLGGVQRMRTASWTESLAAANAAKHTVRPREDTTVTWTTKVHQATRHRVNTANTRHKRSARSPTRRSKGSKQKARSMSPIKHRRPPLPRPHRGALGSIGLDPQNIPARLDRDGIRSTPVVPLKPPLPFSTRSNKWEPNTVNAAFEEEVRRIKAQRALEQLGGALEGEYDITLNAAVRKLSRYQHKRNGVYKPPKKQPVKPKENTGQWRDRSPERGSRRHFVEDLLAPTRNNFGRKKI